MDSKELIRAITDLSRKDIDSISMKKGAKDYTWEIKMAAPIDKWNILIRKIITINDKLKNIAGGKTVDDMPVEDIKYTEDEKIVIISVSKYVAGNYGYDVRVSNDDLALIERCVKQLESSFS
jgi:hypothetical protein